MIQINKLKVPYGIRYISDWGDYEYPHGHIIVDKGVTGCGYTEYCLRNDLPIVLCSPRKLLLENKYEQHVKDGDRNLYYLKSKTEGHDIQKYRSEIQNHISSCSLNYHRPPKFLVTYDSLQHVVEAFKDLGVLEEFSFVVDEFQSIFLDAFFKAATEFDFVEYLQDCKDVLYLSATPMLEKYLLEVPEFSDLPYQKLDWSESGYVEKIKVQRKKISSISGECAKVIRKFENGEYPTALDISGNIVESKEAVIYLNSVADILRCITTAGLSPEKVNIICADTEENRRKLKQYSAEHGYKNNPFTIGHVPLKGEPNKKYTFCTRCTYIGSDFYSGCASSYVFADPNIGSLAMDISLDLPQIIGRQRDTSNPFKNQIIVFYRNLRAIESRENFEEIQRQRNNETTVLLDNFNLLTEEGKVAYLKKLRSDITVSQYSGDFVSISSKTGKPVKNKFIELAFERAWEVSQKDYQDKISVTKSLQQQGYSVEEINENPDNLIVNQFKDDFEESGFFDRRMKVYCQYRDKYSDNSYITSRLMETVKDPDYEKFYSFHGTKGCSSNDYQRGKLESSFKDNLNTNAPYIQGQFSVGQRYTRKEVKVLLSGIYKKLGISKTSKASDLGEYFEISDVLIPNPETGKRERGYEILGIR